MTKHWVEGKPLSEYTYEERRTMPGLTMYEQLYGKSEHDIKRELLAAMHRYGVHRIEAQYSGGHDEGGVQDLTAFDGAGNIIDVVASGAMDPLYDSCNEVMSTKYYSWALESSVYGTLYVDLGEKRAWTSGAVEVWAEEEDTLEWKL